MLFGSELRERCDYEKRVIPSIVTRCIDEVETRGMDMEGIYRKSGGSGQVKQIQQGFEKDGTYDIADPDLDIHAVTSALKQYFRKLPNPLITYEAYDPLLEAAQITDKEKQNVALKAAIEAMPQAHRDVLEYLVQHLCRVVKMEAENLVSSNNLIVPIWNTFANILADDTTQPFGRFCSDNLKTFEHRTRNVGHASPAYGSAGTA